jgi:hypothetical protein
MQPFNFALSNPLAPAPVYKGPLYDAVPVAPVPDRITDPKLDVLLPITISVADGANEIGVPETVIGVPPGTRV